MPVRIAGWFLALSLLWLADGAVSLGSRAGGGAPGGGELVALGGPLYFGWLSVALAAVAAAVQGGLSRGLRTLLPRLGFDLDSFASRALALALLASWWALAYQVSLYAATQFHNHRLASLLAASALGGGTLVLLALVPAGTRAVAALTRDRYASLAVGGALWVAAGWVAGLVLLDNRKGFVQLSWGVRVGAVAALVGLPLCLRLARRLVGGLTPTTVYGALACFGVASMVVAGEWQGYAARVEGEKGPSARALGALRSATDFDRDGASAWFGGGDCAPYDPEVHPMAPEIIADGIDNNCLGGDRTEPVASPPPRWTGPLDARGKTHNLVILTIDTVRPDHLPMFGYRRDTTPNLAKHAERSVLFERTYTTAPLTRLAMSSFFSSQRASLVRWTGVESRNPLPRIDRAQPWLPRILQQKGFHTAAFVPRFTQFERRGHGFDYGFTRYDYTAPMQHEGGSMQGFPAEKQIDRAIQWLEQHKSGRFFVWVHLVEPHFEYQRHQSAPNYGDEREDLYDSELWYADSQAGRLLEYLRVHGHFEDTVILIAGDHGESFMEHGLEYHGFELYEPGIRTLGMLSAPGLQAGRVPAPISLLDFAPTLLNLLDVEQSHEELRGQNLLPVVKDPSRARPQVIVELFRLPLQGYEIALIEQRYKLYYVPSSRRVLMFDLEQDPGERFPLPSTHPEYGRLLDHLTAVFETARAAHAPRPVGDGGMAKAMAKSGRKGKDAAKAETEDAAEGKGKPAELGTAAREPAGVARPVRGVEAGGGAPKPAR